MLEMGGFVEEALEVSTGRRREHAAIRQRAQLPVASSSQRRGDADRARPLPGGRRPARAERAPTSCRASARSTSTAPAPTRSCGRGTSRPPAAISSSPATRRATSTTPSSPSSCTWSGRRSRCGAAMPAAAFAIAREGLDRLVDMDDAIMLGQLAIPAMHAAADLAVRARSARDAAAADGRRRRCARRGRSLSSRRPSGCRSRTSCHPRDRLADGASARPSSRGRPARTIRRAGRPSVPAVAARPAPFLEAYVAWRAAEALAGRGELGAAAEPLARGSCDRDQDRSGRCSSAEIDGARPALARRPVGARRRESGEGGADPEPPIVRARRTRRPVRADGSRTRGPRPRRRGLHEPADRRDPVHQREHGRRPRLAHPRQARRRDADRGGHDRGQAGARLGLRPP